MKIFASWSGNDSRLVAELIKNWLPKVLQEVDVWVSSQDIIKGEKWGQVLWDSLSEHDYGLVVLTKNNYKSPWILFESGALSKSFKSRVIPILCNLDRLDLAGSPLSQLQNSVVTKSEIYDVIKAVNHYCVRPLTSTHLAETFDKWWPDFEREYSKIGFIEPDRDAPEAASTEEDRLGRIEAALSEILSIRQNRQITGSPVVTLINDDWTNTKNRLVVVYKNNKLMFMNPLDGQRVDPGHTIYPNLSVKEIHQLRDRVIASGGSLEIDFPRN